MRIAAVLAALFVTLVVAHAGGAWQPADFPALDGPAQAQIDSVASTIAMHPAHIECQSSKDWNAGIQGTFGYTYVGSGKAWLMPLLCWALADVVGDRRYPQKEWAVATAILVLAHEAFHMRGWGRRGVDPLFDPQKGATQSYSEADTECWAVRHFTSTGQLLGLSMEEIRRLYPYAAAAHYRLSFRVPRYAKENCKVPYWYVH